jgi:hypothetical protein
LPLVENIDWDCESDDDHASDVELCSTTRPDDCIAESEFECEADAAESDIGAELESNCDRSDDTDSDELESDDEAMFPARSVCVRDLDQILDKGFPERTLCLELLPLVGKTDWDCRSDCSVDSEQCNDMMLDAQTVAVVSKNGATSFSDSASALEFECESDAAKSGMNREPESNCDSCDDGEELLSDDEMAFPARRLCVHDLSAMMEEGHLVLPAQAARNDIALWCSWSMCWLRCPEACPQVWQFFQNACHCSCESTEPWVLQSRQAEKACQGSQSHFDMCGIMCRSSFWLPDVVHRAFRLQGPFPKLRAWQRHASQSSCGSFLALLLLSTDVFGARAPFLQIMAQSTL